MIFKQNIYKDYIILTKRSNLELKCIGRNFKKIIQEICCPLWCYFLCFYIQKAKT